MIHHFNPYYMSGISRAAILAGFSEEIAKNVHEIAVEKSKCTALSYTDIERYLVQAMSVNTKNLTMIDLNRPDLYRQDWDQNEAKKKQASMREAGGEGTGRYVNRNHKKNKSSKGKHPKNYTPPKKRRK